MIARYQSDGEAVLKVRKDLIPETEQTWREQYWSRMKAYLDRLP